MAYTASVMTDRLQDLKQNFLKAVPSITIGRAIAYTEVAKEFPDIPRNLRRAKGFRRAAVCRRVTSMTLISG